MFDVGFTELLLIFVIGLLILGPERLPRVAAQIGRWVARARRTANQLRIQIEREIALDEIKRAQQKQPRPQTPPATPPGDAAPDAAAPPREGIDGSADAPGDADAGPDDASSDLAKAQPAEEPAAESTVER